MQVITPLSFYEAEQYQGLPYFSLECCSGGSLYDRLAGKTLPAGKVYKYTITAKFLRDDEEVEEKKEAEVHAGGTTVVDFLGPPPVSKP